MKFVKVSFVNSYASSHNYSFKSDIDDLKLGDLVVCDTVAGLAVAKVISSSDEEDKKALKWIVCRLDLSEHLARLERQKRITELKTKISKRVKELQDVTLIEYLATTDITMKVMLTELKFLTGGN